jgi:Tfp pilus assembly protein PilF
VGSAAVLEGSLVKVGSSSILGLHAKRCESGNELFAEQAKVQKKEEVLDALSSVGKQFRIKAGEALSQVKEHSTPLPEATTGSLDALKAFATAMKIANTSGDPEALPWYRRATERDPRFAMAWADLGLAWSNLAEPQLSAESTTMAWKLRNRASQRERYFIDFTYDRQVTGDLEKAYSTLEQWAREYPRGDQPQPQGLLGGLSARGTGRFEQCAEYSKQEVEIDPTQVYGYGNVAVCEFDLNRFDQANAWLDLAAERKLTTPEELVLRYAIAFGKGDRAGMERIAASAEGKKISDHWMLYSQGFVLAHDGRLRMARIKVREAEELADREGQTGPAANYRAAMAVQEALYGNLAQAKADAEAALRRSHSRDVEFASAFALALSGDAARARQLADDLDKRFPEDTFVRFTYLPDLRALADLSRHQPARAVDHLQAAVPYENAANGLSFYFYLGAKHSNYLRGQAYLEQKEYAEAAAEFRKILAHTGLVYADPIGVLSHLQLGRALRMSGDQAQAKAEYEKFFSIWKDADTDNPVLIQAKAEYKRYFGAVI